MTYQIENDEIKKCIRCPMWVFPEMAMMPLCNLTGETIPKGSTPQENDCPLVAISKTETTIDEPVNKPIAVFKFNLAEYKRKMLYQKANEILNGGDE